MISIRNLTKVYGEKRVLEELSLSLEEGTTTCLMGDSGIGKTTLCHILLGLITADHGTIEGLDGKQTAAVFQEDRLCEQLTAIQNVALVKKGKPDLAAIEQELEQVGIDRATAIKPVSQLSGGQKRRVAILRALLAESDLLCLDEPLKGLDKKTKAKVMQYMKVKTEGKTVLLITHDQQEADYFGGRRMSL
jgi:NitT/TauT family transport system ATP-binding protein